MAGKVIKGALASLGSTNTVGHQSLKSDARTFNECLAVVSQGGLGDISRGGTVLGTFLIRVPSAS